jgi:hypothetical protein
MSRSLRFLQLIVQHSMMNEPSLKEYAALISSEPHSFEMDEKVRTSPMEHQSWTAILPSRRHEGRWVVRIMLWVRRDIKYEQVVVPDHAIQP